MPNPLQSFAEAKAPPRNKLMGLVADALTRANEFATMQDPRYGDKRQNQTLGILADVLGLGSIAKTADRLSYGDPLTNAKKANVPFLKPETADALMMAPLSPRTALAAMGMGMGDNALTRAATVWHGSPHKFDKFDASKIGTGEGAQAYGHGLYLAQNPEVAGGYADKLSQVSLDSGWSKVPRVATYGKDAARRVDMNAPSNTLTPGELALTYVNLEGGHANALLALREMAADPYIKDAARYKKAADALMRMDPNKFGVEYGNLYKVDLPDEKIARMLDWDKPLSQQAQAREAIKRLAPSEFDAFDAPALSAALTGRHPRGTAYDPSAADVLGDLAESLGFHRNGNEVAQLLRKQGIPGIRYLDGGSRGAGAGTSNYVVFAGEEEALKILERNGIPVR
jgi:hypothetical protein